MRIKSVDNIKPKISKIQTSTQYVVDQGITYNQAGITYNEATIMYGGYSNSNIIFGNKPLISKATEVISHISKSVDRGQADFYRGMPYGLLLSLTYPS